MAERVDGPAELRRTLLEGGESPPGGSLTRRSLLSSAARLGLATSTFGFLASAAMPARAAAADSTTALPDIQFDIDAFAAPAHTIDGVRVRFPPIYTTFLTMRLARTPTRDDQQSLAGALAAIEQRYAFAPHGLFAIAAYGIPYFQRLPGGMTGALVSGHIPTLRSAPRLALEEAVPAPTDVAPANPQIVKREFNVPVAIEANDMVLILRSDSLENISDVIAYLTTGTSTLAGQTAPPAGLEGLLQVTSRRLMFQRAGLPRQLAEHHRLPYAAMISPRSSMWMSFADQQVTGSGPAAATTFAGNPSARLTVARRGDYFDNGAILHLSHLIEDLEPFYLTEPYIERVQYLFRSNPIPSVGYDDQFTNGGGPAFLPNTFHGTTNAANSAAGINSFENQRRLGHLSALQRSSRAPDGIPLHIRADGPGFDSMDVPDGSLQPKLQFAIFIPTASFFATMRRSQASLDLAKRYRISGKHNGIERFVTATRRQNFLVPPRRNRSFPLVEFVR